MMSQSARHVGVSRVAQLPRGTRVGVVLGYEYPREVCRLSRAGIIRFDYSASETINLRKLAVGRLWTLRVSAAHEAARTASPPATPP